MAPCLTITLARRQLRRTCPVKRSSSHCRPGSLRLLGGGRLAGSTGRDLLPARHDDRLVSRREALSLPIGRSLAAGVKWLLGSACSVGIAWWLRGKIVPKPAGDNSFRLVESKSGRLEKLARERFHDWRVRYPGHLALASRSREFDHQSSVNCGLARGRCSRVPCLHRSPRTRTLGWRLARWIRSSKNTGGRGTCALVSLLRATVWFAEWRAWPQIGFLFATPRKTKGFRARQSLLVAGWAAREPDYSLGNLPTSHACFRGVGRGVRARSGRANGIRALLVDGSFNGRRPRSSQITVGLSRSLE